MRIGSTLSIALAVGVLISLLIFELPLVAYATRPESEQLTRLLSDAADEARELAGDAVQMQTLLVDDSNWLNHALMLSKIKGHVDNMALIIDKLNGMQKSGSELQEQAVQQMLPLVKELSANTTAAINYLNQNKTRPLSDTYKQYLDKNAETAGQLSSMVSSLLDYQQSMEDIEKLRSKLGVSGAPPTQ